MKKYVQFLNIDSNKGDPGGFGRRAKPVLEKQLFAAMSDAHSSSQQVSQGSQMRCALRRSALSRGQRKGAARRAALRLRGGRQGGATVARLGICIYIPNLHLIFVARRVIQNSHPRQSFASVRD